MYGPEFCIIPTFPHKAIQVAVANLIPHINVLSPVHPTLMHQL
jgi:hypothetical protein